MVHAAVVVERTHENEQLMLVGELARASEVRDRRAALASLETLVGALKLDDAERAHLFDLARASQPTAAMRRRHATAGPAQRAVGAGLHDRRGRFRQQRIP
jgi:hypothetical protein